MGGEQTDKIDIGRDGGWVRETKRARGGKKRQEGRGGDREKESYEERNRVRGKRYWQRTSKENRREVSHEEMAGIGNV